MSQRDGYKSVTSGFFKFEEPGDFVEGVYSGTDYIEMSGQVVPKYLVETDDGLQGFLATVQLAEAMARVPIGAGVLVIYTGDATSGNKRKVKQFDVMVKADTQLTLPSGKQGAGDTPF